MNLAELDRNLSDAEREEWQAIYASYRSGSIISGSVVGVDMHEFNIVPKGKRKAVAQMVRCLIVVRHRTKIVIPETEVFGGDFDCGYHVLHSMYGSKIDYVITHIDREAGFAVGSRKLALKKKRALTVKRNLYVGRPVNVNVISVGKNVCTVSYGGYDMSLAQRDVSYSLVSDLREIIHPGEVHKAIITEYDKDNKIFMVSIKAATPHPFDGIETRHPLNSTRIATLVGKYAGGIYCRLYDNVTDVLCSYLSMQYDGDFKIGDSVELIITKYNMEQKLVYGRILRKIK